MTYSTLNIRQFFGHLEIIEKKYRDYNAKCIAEGECYSINAYDFKTKILETYISVG